MFHSAPGIDWARELGFAAPRPSGEVVVRVGRRYLLVSATVARAIRHLAGSPGPLGPAGTVARLEEVVAPTDAAAIERRLAEMLRPEAGGRTFLRRWARGIVRVPLWRPSSSDWTTRLRGRVLTRTTLALFVLACAAAAGSLFVGSVPRVGSLLPRGAGDVALLWVLLTLAAVVHESGHFLVAAHFGVPCREIGLALFYLQPAAYTDLTDSWLAPRRARVWVAVGGLLFQSVTVLAGYAAWRIFGGDLWLRFCFVSIALILWNFVPFLRLDGYWILSHALDEPNLRTRAMRQLSHAVLRRPPEPVWPGAAGRVAALYGALCLLFGAVMYAAGVLGAARLLPPRARFAGLALIGGGLAISFLLPRLAAARAARSRKRADRKEGGERAAVTARRDSLGRLFVNPFRVRAARGGSLVLGGLEPWSMDLAGHERLLEAGEVAPGELDALGANTVRTLARKRFLVPWNLGVDDVRESRQLGFFSLVQTGDPHECQSRLERSTVAILGLGSVGSQTAYLLAAAGLKSLVVCDFDTVNPSNLNRQILYRPDDVGRRKTEAAARRLREINPEVAVEAFDRRLDDERDVIGLLAGASIRPDIVVRALDQPPGILLTVDRACHDFGVPSVGGGFVEHWAVAGPFLHPQGPCLECTGESDGIQVAPGVKVAIFGPLTFWVASWVAGDVMRHLTRITPPILTNRMLLLDGATGATTARKLDVRRRCRLCRERAEHGRQAAAGDERQRAAS